MLEALIAPAELPEDTSFNPQLLADVRDCFVYNNFPERLFTADLLAWMHALPTRPWDVDGPITAHTLARLLLPCDIRPRLLRIGSAAPARGYRLQDFLESWQAHLGMALPAATDEPLFVTDSHESEIPFENAACYAVTHSRAVSAAPVPTPVAKSPAASNPVPCGAVTDHCQSEIPCEHTGCYAVTHSRKASVSTAVSQVEAARAASGSVPCGL